MDEACGNFGPFFRVCKEGLICDLTNTLLNFGYCRLRNQTLTTKTKKTLTISSLTMNIDKGAKTVTACSSNRAFVTTKETTTFSVNPPASTAHTISEIAVPSDSPMKCYLVTYKCDLPPLDLSEKPQIKPTKGKVFYTILFNKSVFNFFSL